MFASLSSTFWFPFLTMFLAVKSSDLLILQEISYPCGAVLRCAPQGAALGTAGAGAGDAP